jgi:hypothetical protein
VLAVLRTAHGVCFAMEKYTGCAFLRKAFTTTE